MNTLQIVGSLALWAGGWLTIGYLIGRRIRARDLDRHIEMASLLAKAGREDTPLRRAQTVDMPDRSRWGPQ